MIIKKRYIALLEVIIAFALIALCVLPLISPQIAIINAERKFNDVVELDHAVNLLFVNILQKLYENRIAWGDIESEKEIPIDDVLWNEIGLKNHPEKGFYRFIKIKQKPIKPENEARYIFKMTFSFPKIANQAKNTQEAPLVNSFIYEICIERRQLQS